MVDSSYPNSLRLVSDKRMLDKLRSDAARGKVYDRKAIATNFAWMRPNDLVFNYVANDWLMGNDPPAFDILAWNNDATNLAARFDADMLGIYAENKAATPGALTVLGTPIDLGDVTCDNCVIAGQTDHITPWMPCYMTTQRLSGKSEVILTSTGHIQTIVNPPGKKRARYFTGPEPGPGSTGVAARRNRGGGLLVAALRRLAARALGRRARRSRAARQQEPPGRRPRAGTLRPRVIRQGNAEQ